MRRLPLSYIYVLSVPYIAALSSISGPAAWGFQFTGMFWISVLVAGILLILRNRLPIYFPWKLWAFWLGYVLLSLAWGGVHSRFNLQDPAQMASPLVVGTVASYAIQTEAQLERLMRAFVHCLLVIGVVFIFFWYGPGVTFQGDGQGYSARPAAMTAAFIGCLFVGRVRKSTYVSILGWGACLAIAFLSGSRMATLVLLILWSMNPVCHRMRSRILATLAICLLAVGIFYSPIFQERFFKAQGGSPSAVVDGDYDGSGRFEAWPVIWEGIQTHMLFGAGTGEVRQFSASVHLDKDVLRPLNDYLTVLFDYGFVGLGILIGTAFWQLVILFRLAHIRESQAAWAASASFLGFIAFLVFAWTENVLVYGVYFLHPLFAICGAAISISSREATQPVPVPNVVVRKQLEAYAQVQSSQ